MDKRHLHHTWTRFHRIKPQYFLIVAILSSAVCIMALRANNQHMIKLREAVYAADKANGDTETALRNLQRYVTIHMNTNLSAGRTAVYPPIQLKYTYDRLVKAQGGQTATSNDQIYTAAQHYCEQQNSSDFSGRNRVPCIQQYVQSHTAVSQPSAVPDALYKFAFVSPKWSPDLAGWSLLIAVTSWLTFIVIIITNRWFKHFTA